MLVYFAHPIDRVSNHALTHASSKIIATMAEFGDTIFEPQDAFLGKFSTKLVDAHRIEAINRHAIDEAEMVVAFFPENVGTVGVPMEVEYALVKGKPVIILTDVVGVSLAAKEKLANCWIVSQDEFQDRYRKISAWALAIGRSTPSAAFLKVAGQPLTKAHWSDAGLDLYTSADYRVSTYEGYQAQFIPCGSWVELPAGTFAQVIARSSTAREWGLHVMPGVIDYGYNGELGVTVVPFCPTSVTIPAGTRLAQLVIQKCEDPPVLRGVSRDELNKDSARGSNGFGSSGA